MFQKADRGQIAERLNGLKDMARAAIHVLIRQFYRALDEDPFLEFSAIRLIEGPASGAFQLEPCFRGFGFGKPYQVVTMVASAPVIVLEQNELVIRQGTEYRGFCFGVH